jgi:leader peptidase (prepilin peptidase)/N-methyltransferase
MSMWQVTAGTLVGAALGYGGALLSPRWLVKPIRTWEPYVAALVNGGLAYLLVRVHGQGLDRYFWQQLLFMSILTTASLVDLHEMIIPNELVIAGMVFGLGFILIAPYESQSWLMALGGAAVGFGTLLLLALLVKGGMGMGDVKLAAVIGLFLGLKWVGMGLLLGFLTGGLLSALLLLFRLVSRKDHIPFGPWLAIGAAIAALYGPQIWAWYYPL